jgi:hypothetical protein
MQHVTTTVGPFVLAFGAVVLLMLLWEPPFRFRMIPPPLVIFGVCAVLTLAFAAGLAVVVKQMDETIPFARLCAQAAAIGESPDWAPLRDSFEMAQIRGECHAPHSPAAEVVSTHPFAFTLVVTFLMPFACLLVSVFAGQFGAIWRIPALLISVVLSGFFIGMVLTSKEGWGPLNYACENVATIPRSPSWVSVKGRSEMVEMRRACGLETRPA